MALISKVDNLQNLREFRPISVVSCLYKILAKILVKRMRRVIDKLVSKTQTTFISGRQIQDGVVVLTELVDLARINKKSVIVLKVDFEKAYDNVNWNFMLYMLRRCSFGAKWLSLIKACVCKSSMSVLVNGSPTKYFVVEEGLKQGDPLSPFLFTIVTEGLERLIAKAKAGESFNGFCVSISLAYELLQFADDTIIVGEGCWDNLWCIKDLLRGY